MGMGNNFWWMGKLSQNPPGISFYLTLAIFVLQNRSWNNPFIGDEIIITILDWTGSKGWINSIMINCIPTMQVYYTRNLGYNNEFNSLISHGVYSLVRWTYNKQIKTHIMYYW